MKLLNQIKESGNYEYEPRNIFVDGAQIHLTPEQDLYFRELFRQEAESKLEEIIEETYPEDEDDIYFEGEIFVSENDICFEYTFTLEKTSNGYSGTHYQPEEPAEYDCVDRTLELTSF